MARRQIAPRPALLEEALAFGGPIIVFDRVSLAFDEIRLAGADSPQVSRRLVAALEDLLRVAPEDRRPPLREQLRLLEEALQDSAKSPRDIAVALAPDGQGIGVASAVTARSGS